MSPQRHRTPVKPYNENIVTFEAMFIGYTEALNRLEETSRRRDAVATYVPLFEALNWAQALEGGAIEKAPWYEPADGLPQDPVIKAAPGMEFDNLVVDAPNTKATKPAALRAVPAPDKTAG